MTLFSWAMCTAAFLLVGTSVDVMRQESYRASLQSTLDRAVLAAADLDQTNSPSTVVESYLETLGLGEHAAGSQAWVDEGLNYRTVRALVDSHIPTPFLDFFLGIGQLDVSTEATAEEKISHVEISMVLDVSGSMGWASANGNSTRLEELKDAAEVFIDTVLIDGNGESGQGLTTVSLVPYSGVVNIGSQLAPHFELSDEHEHSFCPTFRASDFTTTEIDPDDALEKVGHFDMYNNWTPSNYKIPDPWCRTSDYMTVVPHTSNEALLKDQIESYEALGSTAIDLGMKWGVGLLDESLKEMVAAEGSFPNQGLGEEDEVRPAGYDDSEAIKFVVLMTDGENTEQYDLYDKYKTEMSDIWVDERGTSDRSDDNYSLRLREQPGTQNDVYYWRRGYNWDWEYRYRNYPDGGSSARRLSYAELLDRFPAYRVDDEFYHKPYYDRWIGIQEVRDMQNLFHETVSGWEADQRLANICAAAKEKGIVIFSIAFEAVDGGKAALENCASSDSHYFDVDAVEIESTFHAIARQINSLRLIK